MEACDMRKTILFITVVLFCFFTANKAASCSADFSNPELSDEREMLAPKASISLPVFQDQFQKIQQNQFSQLEKLEKGIAQALENEDFSNAWMIYTEVEALVSDVYVKGNIRLSIENASKRFKRKLFIERAQKRQEQESQKLQELIQQEGQEVIINPLLKEGSRFTNRKIRSAVFGLKDPAVIAESKITGLRLAQDGVFTQDDLLAPLVGKGVAGELEISGEQKIPFMIFFDEQGEIRKLFIRKRLKMEYTGRYAGYEPQGFVFTDILHGDFDEGFFREQHLNVLAAIKNKVTQDIKNFESIKNQLTDAQDSYQLLRPAIHDDHSRNHILKALDDRAGMENLNYFMANSGMPIPEDAVYVRNLSHPNITGRAGGVEVEGVVFTNDKIFLTDTFIHEATHAFFEKLYSRIDPENRRVFRDDELVYERDLYYKLRAYFLKSHLHGWISQNKLYSHIYDNYGNIVNNYLAVTEALAYTVDAALSFRGYGTLGVQIKLKDIKFLVDAGLLPNYMMPDGLYNNFQDIAGEYVTAENYYLPLIANISKSGDTVLARKIFVNVVKNHHETAAESIQELSKLVDDAVLEDFILIAIRQIYAQRVRDSKNLMGLDAALLNVLSVSYDHGLTDQAGILWDLFKENAGNKAAAFIMPVSKDLPDGINKALVREFLSRADGDQIQKVLSGFIKGMMQGDPFETKIANALFAKNADGLPGNDSIISGNTLKNAGQDLNMRVLRVEEAI